MKNRRPSAIVPVPFGLDDARRFDDGFAKSNADERKTKISSINHTASTERTSFNNGGVSNDVIQQNVIQEWRSKTSFNNRVVS